MLTVTINHSVKVKKVGVYQSIIELTDDATGEQLVFIEREHRKRMRPGVAKSSLDEAYAIADENGYKVSAVNSTEYVGEPKEDNEKGTI